MCSAALITRIGASHRSSIAPDAGRLLVSSGRTRSSLWLRLRAVPARTATSTIADDIVDELDAAVPGAPSATRTPSKASVASDLYSAGLVS